MDMAGYTKLFSTIVTSTIWREPKETKVLWITMLALANKDGVVEGSVPGLAHMAGLTREETDRSLSTLMAPDVDSRSQADDGRRVKVVDGGWFLVNHAKYRALMNADDRREYLRKKQAEYRRKQPSTNVSDTDTPSTHSEADTEAKASTGVRTPAQEIYDCYPRHVARADALKAIERAMKVRDPAWLMERTKAFHAAMMLWPTAERHFIPYPATWFNQGHFDDDPEEWKRKSTEAKPRVSQGKVSSFA